MTALILTLLLSCVFCVRTAVFGIYTIRQKNISGGIFVIFLAILTLFMAVRYTIKA